MLLEVQIENTSTTIWKQLKDLHEASDKGRAFFPKNMLFSIMIDESASLQKHLLKIKDIREQLTTIEHKMDEEDMVVIILKSLPMLNIHG